jgi:hypothetical protein
MIGITHVTYVINLSGPGYVGRVANLRNRKAVFLGNGINAIPQRIDEDKITVSDVELHLGDHYGHIVATVPCSQLEFAMNATLLNKYNEIRQERKAS